MREKDIEIEYVVEGGKYCAVMDYISFQLIITMLVDEDTKENHHCLRIPIRSAEEPNIKTMIQYQHR